MFGPAGCNILTNFRPCFFIVPCLVICLNFREQYYHITSDRNHGLLDGQWWVRSATPYHYLSNTNISRRVFTATDLIIILVVCGIYVTPPFCVTIPFYLASNLYHLTWNSQVKYMIPSCKSAGDMRIIFNVVSWNMACLYWTPYKAWFKCKICRFKTQGKLLFTAVHELSVLIKT